MRIGDELKFVYVLTTGEDDFYPEQTAVSIHSLRRLHPDAHVVVVTDNESYKTLQGGRGLVKELADEVSVEDTPEGLSCFQKSRYLKTSLRESINGDFVFLDSDTLMVKPLVELKGYKGDVSVVLIQDCGYNYWTRKNPHFHLLRYNAALGIDGNEDYGIEDFFNSGVIVCRDTPKAHELYQLWHRLWLESSVNHGFHADQCSMWRANAELGNVITPLPAKFNWHAINPSFVLGRREECVIFHYFTNSRFLKNLKVKQPEFLMKIRDKGFTPEVDKMIDGIFDEYLECIDIRIRENKSVVPVLPQDTMTVILARKISEKMPWIDKLLSKLYTTFKG